MAITLVQSKTSTVSRTFDFSDGNHTVNSSLSLDSNITPGNTVLLTVDIRTQKPAATQSGYTDYLPLSGNYNDTLTGSTWNNLGSYSTTGIDALFTFNVTEDSRGDRHTIYGLWSDQLSGNFRNTIDIQFYGPEAGQFYGGKVIIGATEWSGVTSGDISFLSNYTKSNISQIFTGVETSAVERSDIFLVNHCIDDDSDDDSTVSIASITGTKIYSDSILAAGTLPDTLRSESYYTAVTSESSSSTITYDGSGGTDEINENKVMYTFKLGAYAVRQSATAKGEGSSTSSSFISVINTPNEHKRKTLTGITVNGMPSTVAGMPCPTIRYGTFKEPIQTTRFIFNSGMSLPFTGYTDPIAYQFFEGVFYRVYGTDIAKDGSYAFNVTLEWSNNIQPIGQDLDDDILTGAIYNDNYLLGMGDSVVSQSTISSGITVFDIKDDVLARGVPGSGPYLLRVRYELESGHSLTGGSEIGIEFWGNAYANHAQSNYYGDPIDAISLERPSRRIKVEQDRFA